MNRRYTLKILLLIAITLTLLLHIIAIADAVDFGYLKCDFYPRPLCSSDVLAIVEFTESGWHLFSPSIRLDYEIFPQFKYVYEYKDIQHKRVQSEDMKSGKGYWIYTEERVHLMQGTLLYNLTKEILPGWHLIGSCSDPANITVSEGNILVIYGFDSERGYLLHRSRTLVPGNGYWILYDNTRSGTLYIRGN